MIGKAATVVIVLSKGSGEVGPDTVVLGIPLLRRIVMAVSRAGHRDILVVDDGSFGSERLLKGTTAAPLPPTRLADNQRSSRILVLASNVLPHPSLLRHLGEIPLQVETAYVLTSGIAAVETADPKAFLSMIGRANDILSLFAELEQTYRSAAPMPDNTRWVEVSNRGDLNNAEEWLLRGLIKDTEGFMSRHVERKISLAVTRRLVGTDITPNQMTAVSVAIGVVGHCSSSRPRPRINWSARCCSCCIRSLTAAMGDRQTQISGIPLWRSPGFLGDNAVHSAVFVCIGLGWWMVDGALLPLLLACSATVGGLLSAGFVYRQTMRQKTSEGPLFTSTTTAEASSRLSNLADALARRDFIYLVVLLSAFGKAHWFLMLAAVGAPIFFMVILWNSYRERVQA